VVTGAKGKQGGENAAEWVENELRETKARLHKVEAELAQALKQTYTLDADLRKLVESMAVSGSVEAALGAFREEVRNMRDQLTRVQDRQTAVNARMEQITQQRQSELGRDRQDVGLLGKNLETLNRIVDQYDARMKALDEITRRIEEDFASVRMSNNAIERMVDELNTRTARTQEATQRMDQEFTRVAGAVERLETNEESIIDRMTLVLEQARRGLERLDKLEQMMEFEEEVREAITKADFERDQLTQRMGIAERLTNDVADRNDEFMQALARLDQRTQQQAAEFVSLAGQLQDLTDLTKTGLKKVYQTLLRQRRRASEAMNQEIKELTQGELHASD
jgi:chromosome segregation ATPase